MLKLTNIEKELILESLFSRQQDAHIAYLQKLHPEEREKYKTKIDSIIKLRLKIENSRTIILEKSTG